MVSLSSPTSFARLLDPKRRLATLPMLTLTLARIEASKKRNDLTTRTRLRVASTIGTIVAVVTLDRREAAHPVPVTSVDGARVVVMASDAGAQELCAAQPFPADERDAIETTLDSLVGRLVVALIRNS